MNNYKQKQQGITGISFVILLLVGAFFINILLVSVPIYLDNFAVNSSLTLLDRDNELDIGDDRDITQRLIRQLGVNSIKSIGRDNIEISRGPGKPIVLTVDYEVRENLFGNVDVVFSFNEMIEFSNR